MSYDDEQWKSWRSLKKKPVHENRFVSQFRRGAERWPWAFWLFLVFGVWALLEALN